ncbi:hypothetical protein DICPUDRAFT_150199 [Dictyostelium purpureum]|uniref:Anaphase-promoting complex subunit 4 WD40 domain-containing protein n=1 Tax=Dictyostelium purpureum TaxID=5786 RepID=F0ZFP9_DICPU|nr:uncharacterized protein DICPUDRAFT_150199 [Dictyostelium purpureum]EGC37192.1 hypothetical protein DICPUDRAFT_150199 [Dictyostelium purpureum]|eukprot:XP_003286243.1 hypothetical protein DICPUDRAFT_150199 [Dictyostelium purpureum]
MEASLPTVESSENSNNGNNNNNSGSENINNIGNVSLISQLGNTRTSPFFSLLRLTSQSNLQELLAGSLASDGSVIHSNEINELFTQTILSNIASTTPVNKGVLGNATFFETHHRAVKGVDFSPNDDHIFCSAGLDAMDPDNPNILVTPNITGKGLSQIDIRSPITIKNIDPIHQNTINDIQILNSSWSRYYNRGNNSGNNNNVNNNSGSSTLGSSSTSLILTASSDSTVKIIDNQKNTLRQMDSTSSQHCVAHTPEPPESNGSCIAVGGDKLSIFLPDGNLQHSYVIPSSRSIMKTAYTHNGTKLFIANNDGNLRLFNKTNYKHDLIGIVYKHSRDIQDLSISKNDEYLVTASADSKVGLIRIGEPIFGPSEFGEIM